MIRYKDKTPIKIQDIDTLVLTCRKKADKNAEILFVKELNDVSIDADGYCHITFAPADTEQLEYISYYFDIEITLNNGYRKTRLYRFSLTEETTIHGDE